MEVLFATNRLQQCYEDFKRREREWGPQVARKYVQRIEILYAAKRLEELFSIKSLRLHPLAGHRAREYSVTLHDRWRLIITKEGDSAVRVKEVTNHYGD